MRKSLAVCVDVNTGLAVALSLYLFVVPAALIIHDLDDPGLGGGQIPQCAFRWHRHDPDRYVPWPQLQMLLWIVLLVGSVVLWALFGVWIALVPLLAALILPWQSRRPPRETTPAEPLQLSSN